MTVKYTKNLSQRLHENAPGRIPVEPVEGSVRQGKGHLPPQICLSGYEPTGYLDTLGKRERERERRR